jgi:organic hydroperoxide reductase OsmC/OhrA
MAREHTFEGSLHWAGGATTDEHGNVKLPRAFVIRFKDKAPIEGSAPAVFMGDDTRHNPESLMVASLMSCHHLTYLALAERAGIKILEYTDNATGTLAFKDGRTRMTEIVLWPHVRVADALRVDRARDLHAAAHDKCFMSSSVNFTVRVEPTVTA